MNKVANISVDVDGLDLYYKIHGLTPNPDAPSIYETGVLRFLELFRKTNIKATFFVIAKDALEPKNRAILQEAVNDGHEIASHSYSHPYELIKLEKKEIERELAEAEAILSEIRKGESVSGFRAPGYNTSPTLLQLLHERGYQYDSSFFPCPAYYLAKAGYLTAYKLLGRPSNSILGSPSVLFTSRHPHPLKDYGHLLEYPMTVTPGLRFPIIGTSLISMGQNGWKFAHAMLKRTPFVQIEFHAIDLTDHSIDQIDDVLLQQPDQKVSLETKLPIFEKAITDLSRYRDMRTLEWLSNHRDWMSLL